MSNLVEKYGNLPLKKNARTVTSRVASKTTDHLAYGRIFNAYNTRYVELDGGAITLYLAREREKSPNYPFADTMQFCSEHTRDSDVIDVNECANCSNRVAYDAGNHNGMPCEWTAFGDAVKGGN